MDASLRGRQLHDFLSLRLLSRLRGSRHRAAVAPTSVYQLIDRLHAGRTVHVPAGEIAASASAWLAQLGVRTSLAGQLAHAVAVGDWPAVYEIGECLSVDFAVAV